MAWTDYVDERTKEWILLDLEDNIESLARKQIDTELVIADVDLETKRAIAMRERSTCVRMHAKAREAAIDKADITDAEKEATKAYYAEEDLKVLGIQIIDPATGQPKVTP